MGAPRKVIYNRSMASLQHKRNRIGIFAGSFDPIHAGHIKFALAAIKEAKLDAVYFLPERRPLYKPEIEHFGHRTAMITRAIRPHRKLGLLELPDVHFTVPKTLPKLQKEFTGSKLVLLMGSDTVLALKAWRELPKLLSTCELAIGLRAGQSKAGTIEALRALPVQPIYTIIERPASQISSGIIRGALSRNAHAAGLLSSVARYARHNWLYVFVSKE